MADIICPSCNERYHETTAKYRPDASPNGSMFRLKDKYRENGWSSFIEDESSIGDNLTCPDCGGSYCEGNSGRVRVDKDQYIAELLAETKNLQEQLDTERQWVEQMAENYKQESAGGKTEAEKVPCPHCGEMFKPSGMHFHIKSKHPEAA